MISELSVKNEIIHKNILCVLAYGYTRNQSRTY